MNINWIVYKGIYRYMHENMEIEDYHYIFRLNMFEMVDRVGFYEYFNPINVEGHGADQFSWTAALIIDLLFERVIN